MAPVSRGYSESALKMKSHLVGLMKNNSIKLSTFERKASDLWDALLHEDFVFSFKNTVEVMAYNKLEVQFNKWSWEIHKAMMTWEEETEKEIDSIDLEMLTAEVDKKLAPNGDLDKEIKIHHEDMKSKMKTYFETSNQSDTLAQWGERFKNRLQNLAIQLRSHADDACREKETGRKAREEVLDKEGDSRSWIVNQVRAIIVKMKTEQEELKKNLEKNKLSMKQLTHMLELLIPEQLEKYLELKILTTEEVNEIQRQVPLTEDKLLLLLQSGKISTEQANRILEQGQLNEEQLQNKFDQQWLELLNRLPKVCEEHINVEEDFVVKLYDHLGQKCRDKLNQMISEKKLKDWDPCTSKNVHLTFTVNDKHIKRGVMKKLGEQTRLSEPLSESIERVQNFTDKAVIKRINNYISKTCGNKSNDHPGQQKMKPKNFSPSFTQELLLELDYALCTRDEKDVPEFTEYYKLELYLTVCGYAINQFEKMVEVFRKSNNPREYLKDEKDVLFTLFKSQYYQLALEKTVASTLCKVLEKQTIKQVKLNLGKTLIDDLKSTYRWFDNKSTLKAKVLLDLGENLSMCKKQALSDCFAYIRDGASSLKHSLRKYTESHCTAVVDESGHTCLENLAKKEVSYLIHFLANNVTEVTSNARKVKDDDGNVQLEAVAWIEDFLKGKKVIRKLGIVNLDSSTFSEKQLTVESFIKEIMEGLETLKIKLQKYISSICLKDIDNRPFEILEKNLVGCCELCPFCQEQCDWGEHEDDIKHRVQQHRPDCLGGYKHKSTLVMTIDLCPVSVLSDLTFIGESGGMKEFHPYKDYVKIYPQWSIPGDLAAKSSSYWKWFTGHYYSEIAHRYGAKEPVVPDAWKNLKWDDVKRDLKKQFNL